MLHRLRHVETPGPTVLVADDDEEFRCLVVEALRSDGYVVVEARDGAETLERVADTLNDSAEHPDILVIDVRMPRLSGLGVLQELRRLRMRLPVVMMTGFSPESVEVVAKRLGAMGVLRKPFDVDDLRTAVLNAGLR
jgi:CheY-like chemotaxis protein